MKHLFILGAMFLLNTSAIASPAAPPSADPALPHWTLAQVTQLRAALTQASVEGLDAMAAENARLDAVVATGDAAAIDREAMRAATALLRAESQGCCHAALREGWHIDNGAEPDADAIITQALASNTLASALVAARPTHPWFRALLAAYGQEHDAKRRAILAANLDRWRWMPRAMGDRYLLVNAAAYEATLWQSGKEIGRWRVVVGKTTSPTPVFAATVSAVVFNPWWEIPDSIVRESVGAMMRNRRQEAARRGYVIDNGRYRQRPGDMNALGRMKLVMPNSYSIYLHDTPSKGLFDRNVRAFSHGCIRVSDAIGLASTLLAERPDWSRATSDAAVASGQTQTVALARPIPVYITYFTAEPTSGNSVRILPDIYGRDRSSNGIPAHDQTCPTS